MCMLVLRLPYLPCPSLEHQIDFVNGERAASDVGSKAAIFRVSSIDQEVCANCE